MRQRNQLLYLILKRGRKKTRQPWKMEALPRQSTSTPMRDAKSILPLVLVRLRWFLRAVGSSLFLAVRRHCRTPAMSVKLIFSIVSYLRYPLPRPWPFLYLDLGWIIVLFLIYLQATYFFCDFNVHYTSRARALSSRARS